MSRLLTDLSISRAKAAASEVILYDSVAPGLSLRVSPHGVRSWSFSARFSDGRKLKMKLGRWPSMSLPEARSKARELTEVVASGLDPRGAGKPPEALTVKDLFAAFIEDWCRRRNRRWKEQQAILQRIVCEEWGWAERTAHELTRREISEQLRNMIGIDGKRAIRANRLHSALHKMFVWAVANGYFAANPMLAMGKPASERVRDRVLNDDEVRALWAACDEWRRGSDLHPMAGAVLMALITGQRMGEVVGLRRDEIGCDGI